MPSNVNSVIGDIEDVKSDLKRKVPTHIAAAMEELLGTAITHVAKDARWKGNLTASLRAHGVQVTPEGDGRYEITVGTDADIAPYAPFIEFGTGSRSEKSGPGSQRFPTWGVGDSAPAGYPYDAPNVNPETLYHDILEWVETKPITPKEDGDSEEDVAMKIASVIVEKGTFAHPFLRPAWFKHRMQVKKAARKAVKKSFR